MILEELLQRRSGLEGRLEMVRETLLGRLRERDQMERVIGELEREERSLVNELEVVSSFEEQLLMQTTGG